MPVLRAFSTFKVPGRQALLQVPQKRSPYVERCPYPGTFLNILQGAWEGAPLPVPFTELSWRETLHPQSPFSHISKSQ